MRAWLGLVVAIAVGEALALVWLARRGPAGDPLVGPGTATAAVTQTVHVVTNGPAGAPSGPVAPDEADPAILRRRLAELQDQVATLEHQLKEQNRAFDSVAPRLRELVVANDRLRRENEDLIRRSGRPSVPPDPRPGVPDSELSEAELRERLRHLAATAEADAWRVGDPVPDGALSDATEADRAAVARLIADEEPRMLAALRGFVRSLPNAPADLDGLTPAELVQRHLEPVMRPAFQSMQQIPLATLAKFVRGEIGLDDLLGADHAASRLARTAANVRRDTWAELERVVPGHANQVKQSHLRLGRYAYRGWQLVIGGASGY